MKAAIVAGVLLALTGSARADELEVNRTASISFAVGGGLALVLSEKLWKADLAPDACRWCDSNALDDGVRDALKWDDIGRAQTISNIAGFGGAPVFGLGLLAAAAWHDGRTDEIIDDELIVVESVVGTMLFDQATKFVAGRERPFVHALPDAAKGMTDDPSDNNLSFFSGHTAFTFSIAVASGTVASLRGYRAAPWIWGAGLTVAAGTGYLRIAGDKHYFTDVLTGAVVGSFVGFAVPYWLHRKDGTGGAPAVGAAWSGGPMLSWSGTF